MERVNSILFVCLGNICRSPTAEGVFLKKSQQAGLNVHVDSAGTAGYHIGKSPDNRSQDVAKKRGYDLTSLKSRAVAESDFETFDLIVAMDESNYADLTEKCPTALQQKIVKMMSFATSEFDEVPDPYYSGRKGFEIVLDLIEQASDGLINELKTRAL